MTKIDKIIVVAVLIFAVVFYAAFNLVIFGNSPDEVIISVDGIEYASYRLAEIQKTKVVKLETEFGTNVIEITNQGVRVIDASCPDKIDVHSGEITKSGQVIVCVPNRLTIRLSGKNNEIDRVTY